jgi:hypothetical protein
MTTNVNESVMKTGKRTNLVTNGTKEDVIKQKRTVEEYMSATSAKRLRLDTKGKTAKGSTNDPSLWSESYSLFSFVFCFSVITPTPSSSTVDISTLFSHFPGLT